MSIKCILITGFIYITLKQLDCCRIKYTTYKYKVYINNFHYSYYPAIGGASHNNSMLAPRSSKWEGKPENLPNTFLNKGFYSLSLFSLLPNLS